MTLSRTVLVAWLLAALSIHRTAANQEVTANVGDDVVLQCSCSTKTVEVIWQIGNDVLVDHFTALEKKTEEPHSSYKNRSRFELNLEKEECSLRLLKVSESDEKKFTCYSIDDKKSLMEDHVFLKISSKFIGDITERPEYTSKPDIPVGASLSVVAVIIILAFIITGILLMRRRQQTTQRMEDHLDPQSGLPIMAHSPV